MTKTPIKIERVMEITGLSKSYLYILVYKKEIPHFKFGPKSLRFYEDDILEWMENRTYRPLDDVVRENQAKKSA